MGVPSKSLPLSQHECKISSLQCVNSKVLIELFGMRIAVHLSTDKTDSEAEKEAVILYLEVDYIAIEAGSF